MHNWQTRTVTHPNNNPDQYGVTMSMAVTLLPQRQTIVCQNGTTKEQFVITTE